MAKNGRKPNWFKDKCADILDQNNLVEFVGRVATGKEKVKQKYGWGDGKINEFTRPPHLSERMDAIKWLTDYGVGKPIQAVEHSGKDGGVINIKSVQF